MYDAAVFIGRFQPFHLGHEKVVWQALKSAKEVIIVIGSSHAARDPRNPFTFAEREKMIRSAFDHELGKRIKVAGVSDYPYDDSKWVGAVQTAVMNAMKFTPDPAKISLIGHEKDHTSYYLKMFPMWDSIAVPNYDGINATTIRARLFSSDDLFGDVGYVISSSNIISPAVKNTITNVFLKNMSAFSTLRKEYNEIEKYKKAWEDAPYPPTFVTTDAVVTQSGHVLLVKRKAMPGKGLWALPGGFLDQKETLREGAVRELKEETRIKVPPAVLYGSIKQQHTFDAPNRSLRGRTITTAFHFDLGFDKELPKVKGSDDAEQAKWFAFKDLDPTQMFEDHWSILDYFLHIG